MVLLVIDTQIEIMNDSLYAYDVFVQNIKKLLTFAREHCVEVIYVRHDDGEGCALTQGKPTYEIDPRFAPKDNEKIFDKYVNSPFKESGLLSYLQSKNETELIVTGLQSDYCINATILSGFEHGFQIYVPFYANTTCDNEFMRGEESYHYYNDMLWNGRYATCLSIDETCERMKKG